MAVERIGIDRLAAGDAAAAVGFEEAEVVELHVL